MHNKHMGDSISSVTHTEGKVPSGLNMEAESAWEAAQDLSEGDLSGAITHFQVGTDDPQGLVVGQINEGIGVGARSSWDAKINEIRIESEIITGGEIGFEGPDAVVRAQITAEEDLGKGHSWNARGFGQYTVRDGAEFGIAAERNYESPVNDLGVQRWSIGAGGGTLGSSDNICAAARGEIAYGNDTTRAFARGAAGICQDGTRYTLETGIEHNVGQYSPYIPDGTFVEGGMRVGNGGQVGLQRELSRDLGNGVTPFVGIKLEF